MGEVPSQTGSEQTGRGQAWGYEPVTTPETTRPAQMAKIFGYLKGLHATHLINLGGQLGLFEALAAEPAGVWPEALSARMALHAAYVRQWCETACGLELLDYDPVAGYRLAPFIDEILARPDGTYYLGGFAPNHLLLARDYARYPELFRTGATYPYGAHDEEFLRAVPLATATLPRMFIDSVMPKLPGLRESLAAGARVLDVGCGAGHAIVEFANRFPAIRCIGLDVDAVSIRLANELIASRGLSDRVSAHHVDVTGWADRFIDAFDLVTMFLVLHEIRPELKDAVLGQCIAALRPGGLLLLFDERYPSQTAELRDRVAIFTVMAQWYERTWGNIIDTREEIQARLDRVGAKVLDETSLSRFYVVAAQKPGT